MAGKNVIEVTDATFQQEVLTKSHEKTVVVDFWAPWCGPCRMLGPILERLANEPNAPFILAKINVDHNPVYAQQFQVQGIPAVKAFRNGKMVGGFVGAQPELNVRRFLAQVAPAATESGQGDNAEHLFEDGRWMEAASKLEQAVSEQPSRTDLRLKLAQALLRLGKGCQAKKQLEGFPASAEYENAQRLLPLADFLCSTMQAGTNGSEVANLYHRAAEQVRRGDFSSGLYNLLSVIRHDKSFENGLAKEAMIGVFTLLGEEHEITQAYRSQLASALW